MTPPVVVLVLLIAANTPGQIRGPKARLLGHPRRTHRAIAIFRALAVQLQVRYIAVSLAELSTRALPAWGEHEKWRLIRGRANNVLAKGRLKIGNGQALRGGLDVVDAVGLKFRYALGIRAITMPARLLVTPEGAAWVKVAVHVPTTRAASKRKRREIVEALEEFALDCNRLGLGCELSGDWNGADQYLSDRAKLGGKCDVQAVYGFGLDFVTGGRDTRGAGEAWDHTGVAYAVARLEVPTKPHTPFDLQLPD